MRLVSGIFQSFIRPISLGEISHEGEPKHAEDSMAIAH